MPHRAHLKSFKPVQEHIRRLDAGRRSSVALRDIEVTLQHIQQQQLQNLPEQQSLSQEIPDASLHSRLSSVAPQPSGCCLAHFLKRCQHNCCCQAWSVALHPLPKDASFRQRFFHFFRCPPHGYQARWITGILSLLALYFLLLVIVGKKHGLPGTCVAKNESLLPALPLAVVVNNLSDKTQNFSTSSSRPDKYKQFVQMECTGNIFGLYILFVCSMLSSSLAKKIHVPPLLGMLMVGLLLKNIPYIGIAQTVSKEWSSALRNLALVVILTRAGLCLDLSTLRRLSAAVFRLTFIPCLVETTVDAIASHYILGFPWAWGFMLGFVLSAVSPAVVVLNMLQLEARGYGIQSGVPTLVIAAASMDDVVAITGFSLAIGIAFANSSTVSPALLVITGPLEALLGVVYGCFFGVLLWYLPHRNYKRRDMFRAFLLLSGGVIAMLGSSMAHVHSAGAIGCLSLAFVAGIGWRENDGWSEDTNPLLKPIDTLWWLFQHVLFVLIGAAVDFREIDLKTMGIGLSVVSIGLIFRMFATFISVYGTKMEFRERLFVPFAWFPKATVQAAIGPLALDTALKSANPQLEDIDRGLQIVTIAAIIILLTAPLGAALINFMGPRLLNKASDQWILEHHHGHHHTHHHHHLNLHIQQNNSTVEIIGEKNCEDNDGKKYDCLIEVQKNGVLNGQI